MTALEDQLIEEIEKLLTAIRAVEPRRLGLESLAQAADEVEDFVVNNLGVD